MTGGITLLSAGNSRLRLDRPSVGRSLPASGMPSTGLSAVARLVYLTLAIISSINWATLLRSTVTGQGFRDKSRGRTITNPSHFVNRL